MKNTILALTFALLVQSCGSSQTRVETAKDALLAAQTAAAALYQAIGDACDIKERQAVNRGGPDVKAEVAQIRQSCDEVMIPILDVLKDAEKVQAVIDVPWIAEAL